MPLRPQSARLRGSESTRRHLSAEVSAGGDFHTGVCLPAGASGHGQGGLSLGSEGTYLQVHRHGLRQDRVLPHLIQVVEPQQDTVEVRLGLPSTAFRDRRTPISPSPLVWAQHSTPALTSCLGLPGSQLTWSLLDVTAAHRLCKISSTCPSVAGGVVMDLSPRVRQVLCLLMGVGVGLRTC